MKDGLGSLTGDQICRYSKKFQETLEELFQKGYTIVEAKVGFLVYWKQEASDTETKIVLPELRLFKI